MDKILTVIVPSYNMEKYLDKDLNSLVIASDDFNSIEVLVVNDGSKDRTLEIANKFSEKYPNVFKVINKSNGNYGSCINAGLKMAKGTFVKIMDADDCFVNKNFLKYIHALKESETKQENLDMIFTDYHSINEEGNLINIYTKNLKPNKVYKIKEIEDSEQYYELNHHSTTYRTSILREMDYKQSEGVSYTDQEWVAIPLLMVNKLKYVPIDLYAYLIGRSGQTMGENIFKTSFDSHCTVLLNMMNCFNDIKGGFSDLNVRLVKKRIICFLNFVYAKFLVEYKHQDEVRKFDDNLKLNYPSFYEESNNALVGRKMRFKYIKHWRENPNGIRFKIDRWLFKFKR